jgi:hypothetical protein
LDKIQVNAALAGRVQPVSLRRMKPQLHVTCFTLVFLIGTIAGCFPVRQTAFDRVTAADRVASLGDYGGGYFVTQFGESYRPRQGTIVPAASYLIGPNNRRYGIETEVHAFDVERQSVHLRERVYVVRPDGKRLGRLPSGSWRAHIVWQTEDGERIAHDYKANVWLFWYTPLLHGPPN